MKKKQNLVNLLVVLLMAVVFAGFFTGCAAEKSEAAPAAAAPVAEKESAVDRIMKRGVLKVGMDMFVPWGFKDKDGNLVGFEVDVATKLAEEMGVEIEIVPTEWSGIIPALLTGKFDVIIGGMGITTERALKVNYSIPYDAGGMDVIVSKKMLPGATSLEDLNKDGIVIAVRMGGTPTEAARKFCPKAELHQFDNDEAVLQDVLNGNAHAAMSSRPTPGFWVADYPDAVYRPLKGELFTYEPGGFVMPKGDPDTIFFFNSFIYLHKDWLKDRANYWFGTKDWIDLLPE